MTSLPTEAWTQRVRALLELGQRGQVSLVTGDAAVAEVMVGAYRSSDAGAVRATRSLFDPDLVAVLGHDHEVFLRAAHIRATVGGLLIDALHVATAMAAGCDAVISHDARMPKLLEMPVLQLDQLDLDQ
jgi:predicted nucleic acid-binding protein